jgi:GNAT superfamily N-acetyltransferase
MPSIEVTQATPADAEVIREVTREAYAKWVRVIGREPKPMTADYETAVRSHRFDLLLSEGVVAGLIETVDEQTQLLIENVAVRTCFQGQGFGRALLAHADQIARGLGRPRIRLYTHEKFAENIRLYLRRGYTIDRCEDVRDAVAVHMSKVVAS